MLIYHVRSQQRVVSRCFPFSLFTKHSPPTLHATSGQPHWGLSIDPAAVFALSDFPRFSHRFCGLVFVDVLAFWCILKFPGNLPPLSFPTRYSSPQFPLTCLKPPPFPIDFAHKFWLEVFLLLHFESPWIHFLLLAYLFAERTVLTFDLGFGTPYFPCGHSY